ncbi:hypothetical protein ACO0RG_001046 [Hanseniaspora osmophila]
MSKKKSRQSNTHNQTEPAQAAHGLKTVDGVIDVTLYKDDDRPYPTSRVIKRNSNGDVVVEEIFDDDPHPSYAEATEVKIADEAKAGPSRLYDSHWESLSPAEKKSILRIQKDEVFDVLKIFQKGENKNDDNAKAAPNSDSQANKNGDAGEKMSPAHSDSYTEHPQSVHTGTHSTHSCCNCCGRRNVSIEDDLEDIYNYLYIQEKMKQPDLSHVLFHLNLVKDINNKISSSEIPPSPAKQIEREDPGDVNFKQNTGPTLAKDSDNDIQPPPSYKSLTTRTNDNPDFASAPNTGETTEFDYNQVFGLYRKKLEEFAQQYISGHPEINKEVASKIAEFPQLEVLAKDLYENGGKAFLQMVNADAPLSSENETTFEASAFLSSSNEKETTPEQNSAELSFNQFASILSVLGNKVDQPDFGSHFLSGDAKNILKNLQKKIFVENSQVPNGNFTFEMNDEVRRKILEDENLENDLRKLNIELNGKQSLHQATEIDHAAKEAVGPVAFNGESEPEEAYFDEDEEENEKYGTHLGDSFHDEDDDEEYYESEDYESEHEGNEHEHDHEHYHHCHHQHRPDSSQSQHQHQQCHHHGDTCDVEHDAPQESEGEEGSIDEEKRIEEGKKLIQIAITKILQKKLVSSYKEKMAESSRLTLLEELEREEAKKKEKDEKKARKREKEKEKKKQQQLMREKELERKKIEEERRKKEAEEKELKRREEQRKKVEEIKKKKDEQLRKKIEEQRKREEEEAKQKKLKEELKQKREEQRKKRELEKQLEKERKLEEQQRKLEEQQKKLEETKAKDRQKQTSLEESSKAEKQKQEALKRANQPEDNKRQAAAFPYNLGSAHEAVIPSADEFLSFPTSSQSLSSVTNPVNAQTLHSAVVDNSSGHPGLNNSVAASVSSRNNSIYNTIDPQTCNSATLGAQSSILNGLYSSPHNAFASSSADDSSKKFENTFMSPVDGAPASRTSSSWFQDQANNLSNDVSPFLEPPKPLSSSIQEESLTGGSPQPNNETLYKKYLDGLAISGPAYGAGHLSPYSSFAAPGHPLSSAANHTNNGNVSFSNVGNSIWSDNQTPSLSNRASLSHSMNESQGFFASNNHGYLYGPPSGLDNSTSFTAQSDGTTPSGVNVSGNLSQAICQAYVSTMIEGNTQHLPVGTLYSVVSSTSAEQLNYSFFIKQLLLMCSTHNLQLLNDDKGTITHVWWDVNNSSNLSVLQPPSAQRFPSQQSAGQTPITMSSAYGSVNNMNSLASTPGLRSSVPPTEVGINGLGQTGLSRQSGFNTAAAHNVDNGHVYNNMSYNAHSSTNLPQNGSTSLSNQNSSSTTSAQQSTYPFGVNTSIWG